MPKGRKGRRRRALLQAETVGHTLICNNNPRPDYGFGWVVEPRKLPLFTIGSRSAQGRLREMIFGVRARDGDSQEGRQRYRRPPPELALASGNIHLMIMQRVQRRRRCRLRSPKSRTSAANPLQNVAEEIPVPGKASSSMNASQFISLSRVLLARTQRY